MRTFLAHAGASHDKFLIANLRKDGTPFLNLVYMAKISLQVCGLPRSVEITT